MDELPSTEYDYIVIGGGPGSLLVASLLAEDPNVRVLVVDSCPSICLDSSRYPCITLFDSDLDFDTHYHSPCQLLTYSRTMAADLIVSQISARNHIQNQSNLNIVLGARALNIHGLSARVSWKRGTVDVNARRGIMCLKGGMTNIEDVEQTVGSCHEERLGYPTLPAMAGTR